MGTFDATRSHRVPLFSSRPFSEPQESPLRDSASPITTRALTQRALGALLALACASGQAACGSQQSASPTTARNVLLITVDTLRADRLGSYGYAKPTSPAVDALAARSILFENAEAQSAWTLPSLASLMTSFYTSTHRCWSFDSRLDESFTTLAERLRAAGYATAGVASHVFLGTRYGLQQGFEEFDVELVTDFVASHEAITSEQVTARGLRWLAERGPDARPFLLWVHYFDPHATYRVHAGLSERFGTRDDASRYDGEVAFTDRAIEALLAGLGEAGLGDDTIVVLISDHGEEFGEHGGTGHGRTLHREVLHVPLIMHVPGIAPRRVTEPVESIDVLPTLLELLELEQAEDAAGRSLVSAMRGDALPQRPRLAELALNESNPVQSFSADGWKLVRQQATGRALLFDLVSDPAELENVAGEHPEVVTAMLGRLDGATAHARRLSTDFESAAPLELSADEVERLRALGYVGP